MIKSYIKSNPKKTILGTFLLFTFSAFIYPTISKNTIEVYMGIIPEEFSPLIKSSLTEDKSNGSTLITSRTNIRPKEKGGRGKLLEQNLNLYSKNLEKDKNIAVTTDKNLKDINDESDVVRQLARKIRENTSLEKINIGAHYIPGFKLKMFKSINTKGQLIISVAKIGNGRVKRIFVQLPEMGFQAELCYRYGIAILDAIAEQFPKNKIMFTTAFADKRKIGGVNNNINIRLYKEPKHNNKYIAKISTINFTEEKILFQTNPYKNPYKALEIARLVFLRLGDIPAENFKLSSDYINGFLYKTKGGKNLYGKLYNAIKELRNIKKDADEESLGSLIKEQKEKIASLKEKIKKLEGKFEKNILKADKGAFENYIDDLRIYLIKTIKDGKTSISTSYFFGDLTKEAGNNIGRMIKTFNESGEKDLLNNYKKNINTQILSVNMEDDIVFRIYKYMTGKHRLGVRH